MTLEELKKVLKGHKAPAHQIGIQVLNFSAFVPVIIPVGFIVRFLNNKLEYWDSQNELWKELKEEGGERFSLITYEKSLDSVPKKKLRFNKNFIEAGNIVLKKNKVGVMNLDGEFHCMIQQIFRSRFGADMPYLLFTRPNWEKENNCKTSLEELNGFWAIIDSMDDLENYEL